MAVQNVHLSLYRKLWIRNFKLTVYQESAFFPLALLDTVIKFEGVS